MSRMIFISLPVTDLSHSMAFYRALGFTNEPRFSDDTAAAMVISEHIFVMLLTRAKWRTFTDRPIAEKGTNEASFALSCNDRAAVDAMIAAAQANGGEIDVNPPQDHGFMYQRTLVDPDGHVWEPTWMHPKLANGEHHIVEAEN